MNKVYVFSLLLVSSLTLSCSSMLNNPKIAEATALATKAFTVSDAEVAALTAEFIEYSDKTNKIPAATDKYAVRLKKLTDKYVSNDGMKLNFKVYVSPEVNAFATADGSVRVYTGLMDIMTDAELLGVIGHEIGHVANSDVRDAMVNSYVTAALASAVGAVHPTVATLTDSQLGAIAKSYVSAQYSQKQENSADDYGINFLAKNGYDPMAMSTALGKLGGEGGGSSDALSQMFSSHPDSAKRAERMKQRALELKK